MTTAGPSVRGPIPGRALAAPLAVFAVLLVVVAGIWGIQFGRSGPHDGGPPWTGVPGGHLRVGRLVNAEVDHAAMKGMGPMTDADAVPDGYMRVAVDVSVSADRAAIDWRNEDLVLATREGARATAYRAELGDGSIPKGTQVTGTVVFDVPRTATAFTLAFHGGEPVALVAAPGVAHTPAPTSVSPSSGHHH